MSRKALEVLWLALAVLSLGAGVFKTYTESFRDSYQFFVIFLVAVFIFSLRRRQRRNSKL